MEEKFVKFVCALAVGFFFAFVALAAVIVAVLIGM